MWVPCLVSLVQTQSIRMESGLRFRFVWLTLLLSTTLFTACKKPPIDPVTPVDAATQSAGTYTYSALAYNGITVPADQTTLKGTIRIVRQTATTVSMNLDIRQRADGSEFIVGSLNGVIVTDNGSGKLSLTYQGDSIATIVNNKLTVESEDEKGVSFSLTATK